LALELCEGTGQEKAVKDFVERTKNSHAKRGAEEEEKEGIFTGAYCRNPFTGETIPIYLANFVLMEYGTGAVMAVPAHDQRDFEFARKYGLPVRVVIHPKDQRFEAEDLTEAYIDEGVMVDSGPFSGLNNVEGQEKIAAYLEEEVGVRRHSLSFTRLGCLPTTLLGHSYSDHILRPVRCCSGP
jgi:leucyl-tRNA synthetase